MDSQTGSQTSCTTAEWRLVTILFAVHLALAFIVWAIAAYAGAAHMIAFPPVAPYFGFGIGQLTLAAVWAAYGSPRLIFRGLAAMLMVALGGYSMAAGFLMTGGEAEVAVALSLVGGEWFLFVAATLISVRWLLGRRIVHRTKLEEGATAASRFSLLQLFGLSGVFALPLAAPQLFSPEPAVTLSLVIYFAVLFPAAMIVAAPLGRAILAQQRFVRKLAIAVTAVLLISTVESWAAVQLLVLSMDSTFPMSRAALYYEGFASVFYFNGAIAGVVLCTLLVVRAAGYRFAGKRSAASKPAPEKKPAPAPQPVSGEPPLAPVRNAA